MRQTPDAQKSQYPQKLRSVSCLFSLLAVFVATFILGRKGGRQFELTKNQIRLAQSAMANRDTSVADLCRELGISRATLYRYVEPAGQLRDHARRVLKVDAMAPNSNDVEP